MSWALVATAAAGLNAGAGLHCALVESSAATDPRAAVSYGDYVRATAGSKLSLSNGLSALSAGAALGAYLAGGDNADPAWLTCALVAGTVPLFNLAVLQPTASMVTSPALEPPLGERDSWVASLGRKSWVATGLAAVSFGCMLLVLGYGTDAATEARGRNPIRFH